MNMTCLLPNTCIGATMWEPHPCGGYYLTEAWCYGPHGRIGYWTDRPRRNPRSPITGGLEDPTA